jgi:hypothetical protein
MIFELTGLVGKNVKQERTTNIKIDAIGQEFNVRSKAIRIMLIFGLSSLPVSLFLQNFFGSFAWIFTGVSLAAGYFFFLTTNRQTNTDNFSVVKNALRGKKLEKCSIYPYSDTPVKIEQKLFYEFGFAGVLAPSTWERRV